MADQPRIENDSGNQPENTTEKPPSERDWLFHVFVTAPLVVAAIMFAIQHWIEADILRNMSIGLLSFGIFIVAFGVVRAREDVMIARQVFRTRHFRNCLVIAFRLPLLRSVIGFTLFPGSQHTFESPANPAKRGEPNAIVAPFAGPGANAIRELVPLQVSWRLAIITRSGQLVMSYQRELTLYGNTEGFKRIETQVNAFIKGEAIAFLAGQEAAQFFSTAGLQGLNGGLTTCLTKKLASIGVIVDKVALELFVDLEPNGFVNIEERKEQARQSAEARVVEADRHQVANLAEQDARIAILDKEQSVIKKQLENELERVKIGVADLKVRLEVFAGENALRKTLLKRLDDVPVSDLLGLGHALAEGLKAAGLNPQGALLLMGDTKVLEATGAGALMAILQKFFNLSEKSAVA